MIAVRTAMKKFFVIISLAFTWFSPQALSGDSDNIDKAVDIILSFCGGKSSVDNITLDGDASGGLSLNVFTRKVGGDASLTGKIHVEKSNIRGVVSGLNGAIDKFSASQSTEFRECARPYIDRLLDVVLTFGDEDDISSIDLKSLAGWWEYKYDGNFNADLILIYFDDSGEISLESSGQGVGQTNQFSNVSVKGSKLIFHRKTRLGTSVAELKVVNDGHLIGTTEDSRGIVTFEMKRDFPDGHPMYRTWCPEPIPLIKCKKTSP